MIQYSQGVASDGAVILQDGVPMTPEQIVRKLNEYEIFKSEIQSRRISQPTFCLECQDEHYILHRCCDGRECGCAGQPSLRTNCTACNPNGDKDLGPYVSDWENCVEYRFISAKARE